MSRIPCESSADARILDASRVVPSNDANGQRCRAVFGTPLESAGKIVSLRAMLQINARTFLFVAEQLAEIESLLSQISGTDFAEGATPHPRKNEILAQMAKILNTQEADPSHFRPEFGRVHQPRPHRHRSLREHDSHNAVPHGRQR